MFVVALCSRTCEPKPLLILHSTLYNMHLGRGLPKRSAEHRCEAGGLQARFFGRFLKDLLTRIAGIFTNQTNQRQGRSRSWPERSVRTSMRLKSLTPSSRREAISYNSRFGLTTGPLAALRC